MSGEQRETLRKWAGFLFLFLTPAVMYGVFEWITGNLFQIGGWYLFWNLFLFLLIYLVFFGLTGTMGVSYTILNGIFTFWAMAEYFVVSFRSRPIMLWDIVAFRTAATVAGNYQYDFTKHMAAGVAAMGLWTIVSWLFPVRIHGKKKRGLLALSALAGGAAGFAGFFFLGIPSAGISINMWEPVSSYRNQGYLASTFCVFTYLSTDPPEGYSLEAVAELKAEIREKRREEGEDRLPFVPETDVVPTNIICIMNESFADLRRVAPFETDVPFLEYFDSLSENCVKGNLYVPVFGAMTCNTEFEFLTGNSMTFAPEGSVPFQFYMREPSYSIVSILKDSGYRAVALHANQKYNWNRDGAYEALGFDEFYGIESFDTENGPYVRGLIGDQGDYEKIISLTEGKKEGEPLFIFDVTMQNHGGYSEPWGPYVRLAEDASEAEAQFPMTEQYLSLIRESDKALEFLLNYYSQVEEPTMIVLFGDHQPAIEQEFYEKLYGAPLVETEYQDLIRRHITPFLIWTNYPTESMDGVEMGAHYLAGAALQRANIPLTDYLYFQNELWEAAPVDHMYGYMRPDGILIDWSTWREQPEYELFRSYGILQYHNMFEKDRDSEIFRKN